MKSVSSIVAITALAGAVAGCAQEYGTYPRYGYSQAAYYPATGTYYSYPAPAYYNAPAYYSAPTYYSAPPPSYTKSNVYSSKWDYYRNYHGIHDGPERTGP
jgi:hypothetical protein